jgi:hypothetical protein
LARGHFHTRPPKCSPYIAAAPSQDYSSDALSLANLGYHNSHASSHHRRSPVYPAFPPKGPDSLQ